MITYRGRNINQLYFTVMSLLKDINMRKVIMSELPSRNGPVYKYPVPVTSVYEKPNECVLLDKERDCNPFFHVVEALWMLLGRNDVATLDHYNSNMKNYSDDGLTFHGAYGWRWRNHFHPRKGNQLTNTRIDQLEKEVIQRLQKDPFDRRVVLAMYDPCVDTGHKGLDIPCNTHVYFMVDPEPNGTNKNLTLSMTICCRSNDIIWGAYGANAVHFPFLQSYVAASCGFNVGRMYQISNNFHAYKDKLDRLQFSSTVDYLDVYREAEENLVYSGSIIPLVTNPTEYLVDASKLLRGEKNTAFQGNCPDPFLRFVVAPMLCAWESYKQRNYTDAINHCYDIQDAAWQLASLNWISKRGVRHARKWVPTCLD